VDQLGNLALTQRLGLLSRDKLEIEIGMGQGAEMSNRGLGNERQLQAIENGAENKKKPLSFN
jgi:hypothetical protein